MHVYAFEEINMFAAKIIRTLFPSTFITSVQPPCPHPDNSVM